jgi:hypothetical protein
LISGQVKITGRAARAGSSSAGWMTRGADYADYAEITAEPADTAAGS